MSSHLGELNQSEQAAAGWYLHDWRCMAQATHQSAAVVGIAVVAMGEELGKDMSGRALEHLLQYGDPFVRRAPSCIWRPHCQRRLTSALLTCSLVCSTLLDTSAAGVVALRTHPASVSWPLLHHVVVETPRLSRKHAIMRTSTGVLWKTTAGGRCRWRWRC